MRINLKDPGLFERDEFGEVFAWLRANEPVHWHDEADGPGFWVLSRHADVSYVYSDDDLFSSRLGMRLDSQPEAVAAVADRMLIVTDPPTHTKLRQVIARGLGRSEMPKIERIVTEVSTDAVTSGVKAGELDFLSVAKRIPNQVVCDIMGLPREHWEWIGDTMTEGFDAPDAETRTAAYGELFLLFTELLDDRRQNPGEDIISIIANARQSSRGADSDGRALTDEEIIVNCHGLLAGANETTRYCMAGAVLEFARNPEQWEWLRRADAKGIAAAVEEILRWTSPGVHVLRTVTRSTEIAGVSIAAGDRVTAWNVSANRDESVFDEPDRFLLDRNPNRHVTFGVGRHFCIGARVARLEMTAFLTELRSQVDRIELTGEPEYNSSNFTWGLHTLPVRLVPVA